MTDETNKTNETKEQETTIIADNPAVQTAKGHEREADRIITLSTGVRVRLRAVSASLIDEVRSRVKDPPVPVVHDEEKGRDLPNPSDPEYLKALEDAEDTRNRAASDAMIMFGVELVDGLPEDSTWIKRLNFLGIEVNSGDDLSVEFAYKKYQAIGAPDLPLVYSASAVTDEEVQRAINGFRGN